MSEKSPLIVGVSGASGVVYGIRILEVLRALAMPTHLVLTPNAERNIGIETDRTVDEVKSLATVVHDYRDVAASISSGSFSTAGMVVAPCSIRTLSDIAHSRADNLLVRAADVTLKESRRLVILPRETPLHKGHIKLMLEAVDNGAILLPPLPAFYHRPKTIADIIDQTVGKVLDQFDIKHHLFERWGKT